MGSLHIPCCQLPGLTYLCSADSVTVPKITEILSLFTILKSHLPTVRYSEETYLTAVYTTEFITPTKKSSRLLARGEPTPTHIYVVNATACTVEFGMVLQVT